MNERKRYSESNKFNGYKPDWPDYSNDVFIEIKGKGGQHALDYLRPEYPKDAAGVYQIPEEYDFMEVPRPLLAGRNVTVADQEYRVKLIQLARDHNKELKETMSIIYTAITSRLSKSMLKPLEIEPNLNMYVFFRNLRTKFGPTTVDSTSNALKENQLNRELVMKDQDRFAGFIGEFDTEWDRLKATKDSKLAKLLTQKSKGDPIQVLPDRFEKHIEKAILNRMNYDDFCASLLTADDDHKGKRKAADDEIKKVKAVGYKQGTPNANCKLCMLLLEKMNNYNACCADCALASIGANNEIYSKASGGNKAKGDGRKLVPAHYNQKGSIKPHNSGYQGNNFDPNYKGKIQSDTNSNNTSSSKNTSNKRKQNNQSQNTKSNYKKSNVRAMYIMNNGDSDEEIDGDQVVDNHVNNYVEVEASDDDGDDDNIPRAKSARVRVISNKQKSVQSTDSFEPKGYYRKPITPSITYHIKKVQSSLKRQHSSQLPTFKALIDTGSEANCAMSSMIPYLHNVKYFTSAKQCPQQLTAANEQGMKVIAEGKFTKVQAPVYVIENITQNILSPESIGLQLQTFHTPIVHDNKEIYCVLYDKHLNVKLVGDKDLVTDVAKYETPSYADIDVVQILQGIKATSNTNSIKRRILLPYGYSYTSKASLVEFINQSFLYSKKDLLEAPDLIDNFPITYKDIAKHFIKLQAYREGHQKLAAKSNANSVDSMPNSKDKSVPAMIDTSDIEYRNMILGFEVGSDQVGPFKGSAGLLLVDKASNYVLTEFYASKTIPSAEKEPSNQVKSAVVKGFRVMNNIYKKYNHNIKTLKSDSHSIFRSSVFKDACNELAITQDLSSPGIKQRNGLAERAVGLNSERVTAMFRLAPYIPHVLWTFLFALSTQISNLKRSRVIGSDISRTEEFTGIRPNYQKIPILPAGIPISCTTPKDNRDKFGSHTSLGMYIGVDPLADCSIIVWVPATKRIIYTQSYEILSYNQAPYDWKTLDPFQGSQLIMRYNADFHEDKEIEIVANDDDVTTVDNITDRSMTDAYKKVISDNDNRIISNTDNRSNNTNIPTSVGSLSDNKGIPTDIGHIPNNIGSHNNNNISYNNNNVTPAISHNVLPLISEPSKDKSNTKSKARTFSQKSAKIPTRKSSRLNTSTTWKAGPVKFRQISNKKASKLYCEVRTIYKIKKKNRSADNPSYKKAMQSENAKEWLAAIQEEMDQMNSEEVFSYVQYDDIPTGANIIGSMFVLQRKRDKITGDITKYKARLCALGNQQKQSSFVDIKSQTVRSNSVKMLLAIKAKTQAKAMVIDIKGAYLKSFIDKELNENLFLKLPDGKIARLNKYIYGLKQSGLQWQKNVTSFLLSQGYKQTADPLVLIKRQKDQFIIVSLHVDDFLVVSNNNKFMSELQTILRNKYKDITVQEGDTLQYLGLSIQTHIDDSVSISQPAYVDKILDLARSKWELTPTKSPMATEQTYNNNFKHIKVDKIEYLKFVGSINYLATYSRPDLLYHLSRVAQSCSDPSEADMLRVKKIFRYILFTKNKKLYFNNDKNFNLECYVDASNNCYLDGKGHYGYGFCFGGCCFFLCKSSKLRMVTMSSTEAEYCALAYACMELLYCIQLLKDLGFYNGKPVKIYEDNQPVINMLHNDSLNYNTSKHINPRFHFTKDLLKTGIIQIEKIPTADNIADLFTKALSSELFEYLSEKLMN